MIGPVVVVPSTPLVLPGLPGKPEPTMARLAAAARRVMADVVDADLVVVLAGGDSLVADPSPSTDLKGYGLHLAEDPRTATPADLVAPLADVAGLTVGDAPSPDAAVLTRQVPAGRPVVAVTVPVTTTPAQTGALAAAIVGLADDGHRLAVVVAGDLGAGHGQKPPRPDAAAASARYDEAVVAALDNGRPVDLLRLDVDLGVQACARAAGALRVLGALLQRVPLATVVRDAAAPLGVGYVVAQGG